MANAQFEVWVKGKFKRRFASDDDPTDAVACVELLRSQARSLRARVGDVELRVRDSSGRPHGPYRAT